MPQYPLQIGPYVVGAKQPLLLIAGPCVVENESLTLEIAGTLKQIAQRLAVQLVFKASFDKANRTSESAFRGQGLEAGLAVLAKVRAKLDLPVTTDLHESHQAGEVAKVVDLLQIPAFLARQTDLLVAAAKTGRAVHVKKGQFMAPWDMRHVVKKLEKNGCQNILLGERGTFFGYGRLVNDFRSLVQMRETGAGIVFDATHSVQEPSGLGSATGGNREMVEPLARAAMAVGIDGLFIETHPHPDSSPSDGPNMVPLDKIEPMLARLLQIRQVVEQF